MAHPTGLIAAFLMSLGVLTGAAAQSAAEPDPVEAFLDTLVPELTEGGGIAGATVSVVRGGEVIAARGYGYADVESRTMVDPARTMFRIGSVSKVATYALLAELVAEGRVDLDADVRDLIETDVVGQDGTPITVRHLVTHTAGFEELLTDLEPAEVPTVRDFLAARAPDTMRAPGEVPAYSNYGATLAARIVEVAYGQSFDDLVESRLFGPLGMTASAIRQPVADGDTAGRMASGYANAGGPAQPFQLIGPYPAGSISSTATDMGAFMAMLLGHRPDVLGPDVGDLLLTRLHGVDDRAPGMAFGLYESPRRGVRVVAHAGGTHEFISNMFLLPDQDLGLFVSMNSQGVGATAGAAQRRLLDAFVSRFVPEAAGAPSLVADAATDDRIAGRYHTTRRFADGPMLLAGMLSQMTVAMRPDGSVVVSGLKSPAGLPRVWRPIGEGVYAAGVDDSERLTFVLREEGPDLIAGTDLLPVQVLERVPAHRSAGLNMPLLILAVGLGGLTFVLWPVVAIVRRKLPRDAGTVSRADRLLPIAARVGALLCAVVLVAWIAWIASSASGLEAFQASVRPKLRVLQLLGWLAVAGGVCAAIVFAKRVGARRWWRAAGWAVSLIGFVSFLWVATLHDLLGPGLEF